MADMANAFPSKYLKAADLNDQPRLLKMSKIEFEDVGGDGDRKPVLYFHDEKKALVLNKTNNKTIIGTYGRNSDNWNGKPLVLFPAMVDFRGDQVEAIRVRMPKPGKAKAAAPEPKESENPGDDMSDEIPF